MMKSKPMYSKMAGGGVHPAEIHGEKWCEPVLLRQAVGQVEDPAHQHPAEGGAPHPCLL